MVKLADILASNLTFKELPQNNEIVAVFVGATKGIGMGTLKQFAKYANSPKVYILGRSSPAANELLREVKQMNPGATYRFIETDVSLIKDVDHACEEIKSKEKKVDILFMTPNVLSLGGRQETTEGIDISQSLRYYSRIRLTQNLLPLLTNSSSPRVISIFGGGKEKPINLQDLELRTNFSAIRASEADSTKTTLSIEELARLHPTVTFIHKFPGFVNTGAIDSLLGSATGVYFLPAMVVRYTVLPVLNKLVATSVEEAGERGVFLATSARYPPVSTGESGYVGVPLPSGVHVAGSSVVQGDGKGNGVYRLGPADDSAPDGVVLPAYRRDGVGKLVLEETHAVWERALSK